MITTQRKHYGVESFSFEGNNFFKLELSTNLPITELSNEEMLENLDKLYYELEHLFLDGENKDAEASTP